MVEADELSETVRTGIDAFTAAACQVFAGDLVSIVLFGSAAEGRLRATSDVNLILVLRRSDPAALAAIGPAYRLAHAALRLSVMFLLDQEIALASDAFAVKFADVSARHRVLYGSDPFAGLSVDRASAIRRLRQVLINLKLRLRERMALSGPFPEQLALAAAETVGPLRACAALLRSLESGAAEAPREALIALAGAAGKAEALAVITRARELGGVPEAGADAAILAALDLVALLEGQAESLA